jgi:hypothetical protein
MKSTLIERIKSQLKALVTKEAKLSTVMAGDIVITSPDEIMAIGSEVYTTDVDGNNIVLADGEYTLDGGIVIMVVGGKITEMEQVEVEVETMKEQEPMEGKLMEDAPMEDEKKDEMLERVEKLEALVQEMLSKFEAMNSDKEALQAEFSKFSGSPATNSIEVKSVELKNIEDKTTSKFDAVEFRELVRKNSRK